MKGVFFLSIIPLFCLQPNKTMESLDTICEITGIVKVYGSEPHTNVGIATDDGYEYSVVADKDELLALRKNQGNHIVFSGFIKPPETDKDGKFIQEYGILKDGKFILKNWSIIK